MDLDDLRRRLRSAARKLAARLDDLLFPERLGCLCCAAALGEGGEDGLCPDCVRELAQLARRQQALPPVRPAPGLHYVSAAYPYEGAARRLILLLKFSRVRAAALPLARAMALLPGGEEEIIVPMPTTKRRFRQRGFNQAQLLAELMARQLGMPLCAALAREDDRPAQSSLRAAGRRRNLAGCMRASAQVRGKRVLLVDDVYTTGSTAQEAARALRAAGAGDVGFFCAARSVLRGKRAGFRRRL